MQQNEQRGTENNNLERGAGTGTGTDSSSQKKIAEILLEIKAVALRPEDPFTWASGIRSPIYCDNRLILSYPESRNFVKQAMADLIKEHFPEVEGIMGTATAGIPMAALSADILGLPMGYVRSDAKKHGKQNQIEGRLNPGQKIVIVEDLISTGGSVRAVVEALREAGADLLGVAAIFTYGLPAAQETFKTLDLPFFTLSSYDVLLDKAIEKSYIQQDSMKKLMIWKQDPGNPDWMKG